MSTAISVDLGIDQGIGIGIDIGIAIGSADESGDGLLFSLPSTSSGYIALGDFTDTRGTAANVTDFEGNTVSIPAGIPLREGCRVVQSLLLSPTDNTTTWSISVGASRTTTTFTPAAQYDVLEQTVSTVDGNSYRLSFDAYIISGSMSDIRCRHNGSATGNATTIPVTTTLQRFSCLFLGATGGGNVNVGIQVDDVSGFGEIYCTNWLLEDVTGQNNQNPSDFVEGFAYSDYENGNTVSSGVVTSGIGAGISTEYDTACLLGDSITGQCLGPGSSDPTLYGNRGWWTWFVAKHNMELTNNYGVSGRSMPQMAESANLDPVVADPAKVCFFLMSVNSSDEAANKTAFDTICDAIIASGKILIIGYIPPRDATQGLEAVTTALNAYALAYSNNTPRAYVADTWTPLTSGGVFDPQYFYDSATHPGVWGAKLIADAFDAIYPLLSPVRRNINIGDDGSIVTQAFNTWVDGVVGSATYTLTHSQLGPDGESDWAKLEVTAATNNSMLYINPYSITLGSNYSIGDTIQNILLCQIESSTDIEGIEIESTFNGAGTYLSSSKADTGSADLSISASDILTFKSPQGTVPTGTTSITHRIRVHFGSDSSVCVLWFKQPQCINLTTYPNVVISGIPTGAYWLHDNTKSTGLRKPFANFPQDIGTMKVKFSPQFNKGVVANDNGVAMSTGTAGVFYFGSSGNVSSTDGTSYPGLAGLTYSSGDVLEVYVHWGDGFFNIMARNLTTGAAWETRPEAAYDGAFSSDDILHVFEGLAAVTHIFEIEVYGVKYSQAEIIAGL